MMVVVKVAGWLVLLLVFVDEVLALVALGYWGWHLEPAWLWVWLLPLAGAQAWFWFASPKARYGHALGRPLVKLLVFGFAAYGLWATDHATGAGAFLVFSVAINALAQIPAVASLVDPARSSSLVD
jgi:hypothetical protein